MLNRAQVLTGFGRYREAGVLLDQVARAMPSQNAVLTARARSLIADLAARMMDWAKAADVSAKALAEWPSAGADGDRASIVLIRQRALLAVGDVEGARALLDRTRQAPGLAATTPGSVADALAMAEWDRHEGALDRSDAWFRHALASADRRGVPAEIVAVADAYAPVLLADGHADQAASVIGRVAAWAARDFDCALLQLELFHALEAREPWFNALRQAQSLAGEREISRALLTMPESASSQPVRLTGT
jgi:tetratricopeptide (TPR) repeat protein